MNDTMPATRKDTELPRLVIVPTASNEDLDTAQIRYVGEQLYDYFEQHLGEPDHERGLAGAADIDVAGDDYRHWQARCRQHARPVEQTAQRGKRGEREA